MLYSKFHIFSNILYQRLRQISNQSNILNYIIRFVQFFVKRPDQKSQILIARALYDYWKGNKKSKLYIHQNCLFPFFNKYTSKKDKGTKLRFNGAKFEVDLDRYFRELVDLYGIEKRLINLAKGEILDIGSNTGYYMSELSKKGNAVGIDISEEIVKFAHKCGISNCYVADIFRLKTNKTFDTITLVECDLGIAGNIRYLKRLLKKLYSLLNTGGQILTVMIHVRTLKYWHVMYTFEYRGYFGIPFRWVYINLPFFFKLCREVGFKPSSIESETVNQKQLYLIRLIKNSR